MVSNAPAIIVVPQYVSFDCAILLTHLHSLPVSSLTNSIKDVKIYDDYQLLAVVLLGD